MMTEDKPYTLMTKEELHQALIKDSYFNSAAQVYFVPEELFVALWCDEAIQFNIEAYAAKQGEEDGCLTNLRWRGFPVGFTRDGKEHYRLENDDNPGT